MTEITNRKSLDLGCNNRPRNPYKYEKLYGIDLTPQVIDGITYAEANLALEPIPFEDNYFDCVSAFDFIEHIPRQLLSVDTKKTRLPFIELMNEIWRVLKPNGKWDVSIWDLQRITKSQITGERDIIEIFEALS